MKKTKFSNKFISIFNNALMPYEADIFKKDNIKQYPKWLHSFSKSIDQYKRIPLPKVILSYDEGLEIFITPFMKHARIEILFETGVFYEVLKNECQVILENQLSSRLKMICNNTLHQIYETNNQDSTMNPDCISEIYKKPIQFFTEYSVLARLLANQTDYWVKSISSLIKRLVSDYDQITALIGSADCGKSANEIVSSIINLEVGLSDAHENGQTVCIIELLNKHKVVYKPKDMAAEHAFSEFVDWFNNASGLEMPELKSVNVIVKDNYGWSEYVGHSDCHSISEIECFFERLGATSAILYALRGTDYHRENLVAHGEYPVLIDHEMLFYPIYVDEANKDLIDKTPLEMQMTFHQSVINSRLFPIIEKRPNGEMMDVSAIGYYSKKGNNPHLPTLDHAYKYGVDFQKNIICGFNKAYKVLQNNKALLISNDGPLVKFKGINLRFNMRRTSSYLSIIISSVVPGALKNGTVFCDYVNMLRKEFPPIFSKGLPTDIRQDELEILIRLDVPRFTLMCNKASLNSHSGELLNPIFDVSGFDLVKDRISYLSESDLDIQTDYIKESLNQKI